MAVGIEIRPGTCRFCGCTDALACSGGCWWIDAEHTVCSSPPCAFRYFAEHPEDAGEEAEDEADEDDEAEPYEDLEEEYDAA